MRFSLSPVAMRRFRARSGSGRGRRSVEGIRRADSELFEFSARNGEFWTCREPSGSAGLCSATEGYSASSTLCVYS